MSFEITESTVGGASANANVARTFSKRQAIVLGLTHILAAAAIVFPTRAGAIALLGMYTATGFGISLGYHRGLSHGAFRAPRAVTRVLATLAALAFQGGPITWVGFHRAHHRFTDASGDPHSATRGFFWSHIGWAFHRGPNGYRRQKLRYLTKSLERDRFLVWLERHNAGLNLAAFGATALVAGLPVALWAFPLRVVLLWHVTWLTNSLAHGAAGRSQAPRNIGWLALIGFGEGLHANHHAFPSSASFARAHGQLDPGYWVLTALSKIGLVKLTRRARGSSISKTPLSSVT
jgi:fatty-acid desaturase